MGHRAIKAQGSTFFIGVILGVIVGLIGTCFIQSRYTITTQNDLTNVKIDKWTGQTWIMKYVTDQQTQTNQFYWEPMPQR